MAGLEVAIVPVTPFEQNCSVAYDPAEKIGAVIDPGGDVPRILSALDQLQVRPERIILTHGHIDHAGGAASLKEELQRRQGAAVPIEGPDERDRFLLSGLRDQGLAFGLAGARNVTPDRWLRQGDTVVIAGRTFEVLYCPGHTPGHVVLVCKPEGLAFVGDVLFQGSIGRTDFPYGDHAALIRSIEQELLPLGDDIAFVCGHGSGSTIGAERRSNPFLR